MAEEQGLVQLAGCVVQYVELEELCQQSPIFRKVFSDLQNSEEYDTDAQQVSCTRSGARYSIWSKYNLKLYVSTIKAVFKTVLCNPAKRPLYHNNHSCPVNVEDQV